MRALMKQQIVQPSTGVSHKCELEVYIRSALIRAEHLPGSDITWPRSWQKCSGRCPLKVQAAFRNISSERRR